MQLLTTDKKNSVLQSMIEILDQSRNDILQANAKDCKLLTKEDRALYDRLVIDTDKIDSMITSLSQVLAQEDPVGTIRSERVLENGLQIQNKTTPFGTIMIIYESRPDVTIEAAVLAFKAGNKILLKGGKEAFHTNKILEACWHKALVHNEVSTDYIELLHMNREQTQQFLKNPTQKIDLIVPRGGERLIAFVKQYANCAVLVSGRGNNFLYVDRDADWLMSLNIILNAKTQKISACNALDKILINKNIDNYPEKLMELDALLTAHKVDILVDKVSGETLKERTVFEDTLTWNEEFLALKCAIGTVSNLNEAIEIINRFSGGHSATIMSSKTDKAQRFMQQVDAAAVYHNASTRFTDGGAMGVGAELAISTDKLHHRGPLGLQQLVTNKYYVYGTGQIRE